MITPNMAASVLMRWRGSGWACLSVARRPFTSGPAPAGVSKLQSTFLLYLCQRFHDVEQLVAWSSRLRSWVVRRKNRYYGYTQRQYGENVATAFYILSMRGAFRFAGQSEWFRPDSRGKFSWDFVNFPDVRLEEVDMSRTLMNYTGLDNLVCQRGLRTLSLQGCPEVDDWFLSRLHVFKDSLEELDLSHCPHVTVGGLAALHHLRRLRRLDLSFLPRVQNPGMVRILLEEVLPHCHITGVEYSQGLRPEHETEPITEESTRTRAHRETLAH